MENGESGNKSKRKRENVHQDTEKKTIVSSKGDLYRAFVAQTPHFLQHTNNVRHQQSFITNIKENLKEDEILIHIDFSENYAM